MQTSELNKRRTTLLSAVIGLVVLAACGLLAAHLHATTAAAGDAEKEPEAELKPVPVRIATAHRGTLNEALLVTGILQPLPNGAAKVAAQVAGRIATVRVRPGDAVRAGQVLAIVSRPELQVAVQQAGAASRENERELQALRAERDAKARSLPLQEQRAQADLAAARAKLALLQAGPRPEEVQQAQEALAGAQAELDRVKAGARPQEIAQAEAAVRDARAALAVQQRDTERKRTLFKKEVVASRDLERSEADLAMAQANLETKAEALSLVKAGARPEEIRAAESKVREAEALLRQIRAGARPQEIQEAEATVSGARTGVESARAARADLNALDRRIQGAQARLDASRGGESVARTAAGRVELRSPLSGVVSHVLANAGDGVTEQSPVVEVVNRDGFRAVLDVPAASRSRVVDGVRAEVTVPGLAGRRFEGTVRAVLPSANGETGLLPIEVWIWDPRHRLAEGMAVNARLLVGSRSGRLFVPTSAIFSREGERFVYVVTAKKEEDQGEKPGEKEEEAHDGKAAEPEQAVREQKVETGREQGEETEVVSGLKEGEQVVRDGSLSLADGAPIQVGK